MHPPDPRRLARIADGLLWFLGFFLLGLGFTVPPHRLLSLVPYAVLLLVAAASLYPTKK